MIDYEENLLFKVAYYYYFEDMTQQSIANLLSISRIRVIKLLDRARQTGIIQFKLRENPSFHIDFEEQLKKRYDLKDVFVVPDAATLERKNANVAQAAALYINDRLKGGDHINVGYGDTSRHLLNNLATMVESPISCISLTGGVSYYLPDTRPHIFNANLHLIPAPLLASSNEMADAIRKEESVNEIFRMAPLATLTVIGIGGMHEKSTIFNTGTLGKNDLTYLKMKGAVGDILSHFLDKDGNLVTSSVEERLISIPLETLKKFQNVIGVAAGAAKVKAIRSVLRGHYLNVLITDTTTAKLILEDNDE
jgi:DNA-binding transcriptional regulator LsrR (DeoR family)